MSWQFRALRGRLAAGAGLTVLVFATTAQAQAVSTYRGPCDASAAVALDAEHFVVANDENNVLGVFRRGRTDALATLPLAGFLGTGPKAESDLEGAARIGERVYWITSHGRSGSGKLRPERHRFFATEVVGSGTPPTLRPTGSAQRGLLTAMLQSPVLRPLDLEAASRLAPEADGGLNIEGLAATADGGLLIGLRNPLRQGKALIVPLHNPAQVIVGEAPRFGAAIALDLGGHGIRSLERIGDGYLLVAGPVADRGDFALYRWSGAAAETPVRLSGVDLGDLRPEALFAWPPSDQVQLLSDDGGIVTQGVACKDRPAPAQAFRGLELKR
jgi:hypothetical protein